MKKLLALAVLATSTVAYSASDIYDIQYLPSAGTTFGFSEAEILKGNIEFKNAGGAETDLNGYKFVQTVGHSFSDKFSAQVSLNYMNLENDTDGEDETTTSGISDPIFQARYRLMDSDFRWDIIGGALVSLGDSEVESDGDTDNWQGGHSIFLGTQFGAKTESLQWAVSAALTHNLEATTEFKDVDEKVKDDANNELLIRGDLLNKLAEKSFIRSHLSANFIEGYDDDADGSTAAATTYELGAEYQHLMSTDLLLRAGIDYTTTNVNSGFIDSYTTWTYRLAANYQF